MRPFNFCALAKVRAPLIFAQTKIKWNFSKSQIMFLRCFCICDVYDMVLAAKKFLWNYWRQWCLSARNEMFLARFSWISLSLDSKDYMTPNCSVWILKCVWPLRVGSSYKTRRDYSRNGHSWSSSTWDSTILLLFCQLWRETGCESDRCKLQSLTYPKSIN